MAKDLKNLKDVTFIIPIRIESKDRETNLDITLRYLNNNFDTNIIVYESDTTSKAGQICSQYNNVKYIFNEDNNELFHRTRFLNEMIDIVKTKVVVNYDVDIILPIDSYIQSTDFILNDIYDLVYPYFNGLAQKKVSNKGRDIFSNTLDVNTITKENIEESFSVCGHCQFFNIDVYKKGGMENENFISYGPEDVERMYRFQKMGYRVHWHNQYIYHLEHFRTQNSNSKHIHFKKNCQILDYIKVLTKEDLINHYNKEQYLKKYKRS